MNIDTNQPTNARPIQHPLDDLAESIGDNPMLYASTTTTRNRRAGRRKRGTDRLAKSTNQPTPESNPSSLNIVSQIETPPDLPTGPIPPNQVFHSRPKGQKHPKPQRDRNQRYYDETRRPIVCLAFVFPLLIFYEIGSILLGHNSLRSGIDQWIHQALHQIGFGQIVLLPLVTIALMIVWHHRDQDHWKIRASVLTGMLTEAIGLGLILYCAANAINMLASGPPDSVVPAVSQSHWWPTVVGLVGSGIYEELVFRIILLVPVVYWAGRLIADRRIATMFGVIVISLLFAALHYNVFNPAGSQFELSSFVFRFVASIVFCVLFLFRGFGIAVGTHVAYDVLTQV